MPPTGITARVSIISMPQRPVMLVNELKSSLRSSCTNIFKPITGSLSQQRHYFSSFSSTNSYYHSLVQPRPCSLLHNRNPSNNLSKTQIPQRTFFSFRKRLDQIETEADSTEFQTNVTKQSEYYKELFGAGNYEALIKRYEEQPQLSKVSSTEDRDAARRAIQSNPECLKYYVMALGREGKLDRLVDKLVILMNSGVNVDMGKIGATVASEKKDSPFQTTATAGSSVYYIKTPVNEWGRLVEQLSGNSNGSNPGNATATATAAPTASTPESTSTPSAAASASTTFTTTTTATESAAGAPPPPPPISQQQLAAMQPIPIIITEAWSWSKFARQMGARLFFGALFVGALAIVLDQQGMMKSGMAATELGVDTSGKLVKFDDVQGVDEAKQELEEVVAFLKEPEKFQSVGGKLPKGVLLYGPPGTGKTHLARAVAGEAGVPFFFMSGSEFDELYVGIGARRVRELFANAKKKAPCIIFLDEIDAVGGKRSAKDQSYMRQTLNQLLVELDGFTASEGVIFIAATNTPEALDKALVRPGRFDRLVSVPLPDIKGRIKILEVHTKTVKLDPEINLSIIARGTPGFSGADLANLINQAALNASKEGAAVVRMEDLEWAKDKIIMGAERKSAVITEANKRITAYHESGHALLALKTPHAMDLHKVTIIPRGNALGLTLQLPVEDQTSHTKNQLLAMLDVCMGGRVAEEIVYGEGDVTTGASNDLEKATAIARSMVMKFGMSNALGLMNVREEEMERFVSSETKLMVDTEIRKILNDSYARAKTALLKHRDELDKLANALVEYETLSVEEVRRVLKLDNPVINR